MGRSWGYHRKADRQAFIPPGLAGRVFARATRKAATPSVAITVKPIPTWRGTVLATGHFLDVEAHTKGEVISKLKELFGVESYRADRIEVKRIEKE